MARTSKRSSSKKKNPEDAAIAEGEGPGIDELLDGLEQVVQQLESGDLPLEQALERFEHGVSLARKGSATLDAVEERVEQLLADRDQTVPFSNEETS